MGKSNLKLHKGKRSKNELEVLRDLSQDDVMYDELEPYYEVVKTGKGERKQGIGLWYIGVGTHKDDDGQERPYYKKPLYLADPFDIIGRGQDADEDGYRILRYKRNGQGAEKIIAFPNKLIGRNDGYSFLRNLDIGIVQSGNELKLLSNYLQWQGSQEQYEITKRGGWTNRECIAYLTQTGDIIGTPPKPIIYIGDRSRRNAFAERGSLKAWQENVCRYLAGNSRPLLALGAVLCAPLLAVLNMESGGFHFYGSSSIGKSISGTVAFSAMGDPIQLKIQWNGTALSFENEAAANNDGCLFLDEIHQADTKVIKDIAYSLFNGVSKGQGKAEGGNRVRNRWRLTAISTGEYDIGRYMENSGIEWTAGQAVRMPAIPADVGNDSVFEVLHGFESSKALVEHLAAYSSECYGFAFPLFVKQVSACMNSDPIAFRQRINQLKNDFLARLPRQMGTQAARVSERFALAAVALELAHEWGITGLDAGVGSQGVLECFIAWHEKDGKYNREEMQVIQAAMDLLNRDGLGERFVNLNEPRNDILSDGTVILQTGRNHAGYRKAAANGENFVFYLLDEVFRNEICKGKDETYCAKVLRKIGWLHGEENRLKSRLSHKAFKQTSRMYCLIGLNPPNYEE